MNFLKKLLPQSRKLSVFLLSIVAYGVNEYMGKPLADDQMTSLMALAVGWMVSQGIADHGQQGAAIAQDRAKKAVKEIAEAVEAVKDGVEESESPKE